MWPLEGDDDDDADDDDDKHPKWYVLQLASIVLVRLCALSHVAGCLLCQMGS